MLVLRPGQKDSPAYTSNKKKIPIEHLPKRADDVFEGETDSMSDETFPPGASRDYYEHEAHVPIGRLMLPIKRCGEHKLPLPAYESEGAAGLDLRTTETFILLPGGRRKVAVGFAVEIPGGHEGQIRPRSGLAAKGLHVALGTIDSDYRGEIAAVLLNTSEVDALPFEVGDRIAQLVISPVARVSAFEIDELSPTQRGQAGFGSTGSR